MSHGNVTCSYSNHKTLCNSIVILTLSSMQLYQTDDINKRLQDALKNLLHYNVLCV